MSTDRGRNNFDFIRVLAAVLVVVHHAFALRDRADPLVTATHGQLSFGGLGVDVFFVISGYLVTQSLLRSPTYGSYFVKRALRIFPGLAVNVVWTVLVLGPLVTTLTLAGYFEAPLTYRYLANVFLLHISFALPGVFVANPFPAVVNGSLWTLGYEFACYVGLAALRAGRVFRYRGLVLAGYLASIATWIAIEDVLGRYAIPATGLALDRLIPLGLYFGAGVVALLFREEIPLRYGIAVALLLALAVAGSYEGAGTVALITVPYVVFLVAFAETRWLCRVGEFGDWSYGTYIYSFPLQQAMIQAGGSSLGDAGMIGASIVLTIPFAVASWFLVERRALFVKDRWTRPGAGVSALRGV